MTPCSTPDCGEPRKKRGLCNACYSRAYAAGDDIGIVSAVERRKRYLRRLEKVAELYEAGWNSREIGDVWGMSRQAAHQLVKEAAALGKVKMRTSVRAVVEAKAPPLVAMGMTRRKIADRIGVAYHSVAYASRTYLSHLDWVVERRRGSKIVAKKC